MKVSIIAEKRESIKQKDVSINELSDKMQQLQLEFNSKEGEWIESKRELANEIENLRKEVLARKEKSIGLKGSLWNKRGEAKWSASKIAELEEEIQKVKQEDMYLKDQLNELKEKKDPSTVRSKQFQDISELLQSVNKKFDQARTAEEEENGRNNSAMSKMYSRNKIVARSSQWADLGKVYGDEALHKLVIKYTEGTDEDGDRKEELCLKDEIIVTRTLLHYINDRVYKLHWTEGAVKKEED